MLVTFRPDATLIFGGNSEPAALAELYYAAGGQTMRLYENLHASPYAPVTSG